MASIDAGRPIICRFAMAATLALAASTGASIIASIAAAAELELRPGDFAIVGATVIDGTGASPGKAVVVIRDGHILAVERDVEIPATTSATVIDATDRFLIPGLADMHVHLSRGLPQARLENETEIVLARNLYYGVTTILAIGASDASTESIRSLRAQRLAGELQAPYIYGTGGHLTPQGTHPIYTAFPPKVRQAADRLADATPHEDPVNLYSLGIGLSMVRSAEAARKAIQERAEGGMDAIKITVESGPTPFGDDHPQMTVEMIRTIVDAARKHDLGVFAHVTSLDELLATLDGGAAGVVHTVWDRPFPDADVADRMAANSFYVMPTTSIYRGTVALYYIDEPVDLEDPFLLETVSEAELSILRDPGLKARFRERWQRPLAPGESREQVFHQQIADMLGNIGMMHERGVPIVLGTDTGNLFTFQGYSVHDELGHLVEAGLTPGEALAAATTNAAAMIGAGHEFGTIEPGKRADLVILRANPLIDIRNTRKIDAVIAQGRLIERESLPMRPQ